MKIIHFLSILILLMLVLSTSAQDSQKLDVIELKNGSIIKGSILEIKPESHVKIETLCSNIWVFKMSEIAEIRSEIIEKPSKYEYNIKDKGFVNYTSFGILTGPSDNENSSAFSLDIVNGYKWNNRIITSIGIGYENFNEVYFPIFMDLRYEFQETILTPFSILKAGYLIPGWQKENLDYYYYHDRKALGGLMLELGAGVKINLSDKNALTMSAAYRYQVIGHTEGVYESTDYDYTTTMNRLSIKFGFCFQ
jgi:hypothetical protein